jgi:hypothetical protein
MPSPSELTVYKSDGKYGCRDCDYVSPYRYRNAKRDVARHWSMHHVGLDPMDSTESRITLADVRSAAIEQLGTEVYIILRCGSLEEANLTFGALQKVVETAPRPITLNLELP